MTNTTPKGGEGPHGNGPEPSSIERLEQRRRAQRTRLVTTHVLFLGLLPIVSVAMGVDLYRKLVLEAGPVGVTSFDLATIAVLVVIATIAPVMVAQRIMWPARWVAFATFGLAFAGLPQLFAPMVPWVFLGVSWACIAVIGLVIGTVWWRTRDALVGSPDR